MKTLQILGTLLRTATILGSFTSAAEDDPMPKASIDGTGTGWRTMDAKDFTKVNCSPGTWSWTNGVIFCTGQPVGVVRSVKTYTNFELVVQ